MYLDKAKKLLPKFIDLLQAKGITVQCEPCTEDDIKNIEQFLNLPLPGVPVAFGPKTTLRPIFDGSGG